MSSKLPKLDFIKLTCMIFLVFIKIKFTHLPFAREFEIGIALYPRKHRANLLSDQTFTHREAGGGRGGRQLVIRCIIHRQAPAAQRPSASTGKLTVGGSSACISQQRGVDSWWQGRSWCPCELGLTLIGDCAEGMFLILGLSFCICKMGN